jgi:hypothetical protein
MTKEFACIRFCWKGKEKKKGKMIKKKKNERRRKEC